MSPELFSEQTNTDSPELNLAPEIEGQLELSMPEVAEQPDDEISEQELVYASLRNRIKAVREAKRSRNTGEQDIDEKFSASLGRRIKARVDLGANIDSVAPQTRRQRRHEAKANKLLSKRSQKAQEIRALKTKEIKPELINTAAAQNRLKQERKAKKVLDRTNNKLRKYTKKASTSESRANARVSGRDELEHTLDTYFDPSNILSLKADLKHEADKQEIDAQVDAIRNTRATNRTRASIEQDVLDSLLARHFGFSTMDEAREVVPHWLEMTVLDMLEMSNEQLENLTNGTETLEESDTPEPVAAPRLSDRLQSRFSFEPDEEDSESDTSSTAEELAEITENQEVIHEENPTYEIDELKYVLDDLERIKPDVPLYEETVEKLLRSIDKLSVENIYSGGTTIPGTDEVVGQTVNTYYSYEVTDDKGNSSKVPLETDLAQRLLAFEKNEQERVEKLRDAEAAKVSEQHRTDAGNDALDKLRNIIND